MLAAPPQLAPGQRELAILVDAETGVAGKIGPDALVDVIATYPGDDRKAPESRVVVPNARIIEVGQPRLAGRPRRAGAGGRPVAGRAGHVRAHAGAGAGRSPTRSPTPTEVRLALLRPGSDEDLSRKQRVYSRDPDPEPAQ